MWYYVRQGYSNYLVFVISTANLMVTTYYLAVKNAPSLSQVFPNVFWFGLFMIMIGIPLTFSLGYFHYKKSKAQHHQLEIEVESNPLTPILLSTFSLVQKIAKNQKLNTQELEQIDTLNILVAKYSDRLS